MQRARQEPVRAPGRGAYAYGFSDFLLVGVAQVARYGNLVEHLLLSPISNVHSLTAQGDHSAQAKVVRYRQYAYIVGSVLGFLRF